MSHANQDQKLPRTVPATPRHPRVAQLHFATESTPVVRKYGPNLPYMSDPKTFKDARYCLAQEMDGRWLGAMPVEAFLEKYLPPAPKPLASLPEDPFNSVPRSGVESDLYNTFIAVTSPWMPDMKAVNTSSKKDTNNDINLKPDVSIYNQVEGVATPVTSDFSQMELWMEFKANRTGAAFKDPPNMPIPAEFINQRQFTPETTAGIEARGQLAHYAGAHHSLQFRHFSFSVAVQENEARLFRWDPSATVVTAAFDYRKKPHLMAEFLWRFSHLSAEQRGHDVSVHPSDLAHEDDARVRKELEIEHQRPLYRYEIPGTLDGKGHAYGPRPPTENRSLVSRCTRTMPAYWIPAKNIDGDTPSGEESNQRDKGHCPAEEKEKLQRWCKERRIYLKDTWRFLSNSPDTTLMPEHEIYEMLYVRGTPNIPEGVTGGDVKDGRTQTEELLASATKWLCVEPKVSQYQHYRLVHGIVGRPLFRFESTKQLVIAVLDALEAHAHAFEHANLLHRDISAGNIILTDDGRGLLIDWELAKFMDEGGSRRPDRTGTWQFMSANLLRNPDKVQTLTDDLESFLHVLAWIMLRFLPAHDDYEDRAFDLSQFDEQREQVKIRAKHGAEDSEKNRGTRNAGHSYPRGGDQKCMRLCGDYYPSRSFKPRTPTPLTGLLRQLRSPFKSLYAEQPPTCEERKEIEALEDGSDDLNELRFVIRRYDRNLENLQSSTWFINTMKSTLRKSGWPVSDGAKENLLTDFPRATERQAEIRASQLLRSQRVWEQSKAVPSSSSSSKRAASPTPDSPSSKRRRCSPAGSGTGI